MRVIVRMRHGGQNVDWDGIGNSIEGDIKHNVQFIPVLSDGFQA